jgi:hypothetical protein
MAISPTVAVTKFFEKDDLIGFWQHRQNTKSDQRAYAQILQMAEQQPSGCWHMVSFWTNQPSIPD